MKTALRAADPVIMLEPKALFASKGPVPEGEHFVPFGVARIARQGGDITVVATGQLVHTAIEAAERLSVAGIEVEIVDPRTIMPLDVETIVLSVRKTHRLLVVDEDWAMCGLGGEIAQTINELAFDELDAPPGRLHTAPTSHPFAPALERAMLVSADRIVAAVRDVIEGRPPVPDHWRSTTGLAAPVAAPPATTRAPEPRPAARPKAASGEDEPILMPFGDLTVSEGTLVGWRKAEGDRVAEGELVAEIETDKSVMEIEAPCAGTLSRIEKPVGAVVAMGVRIGSIRRANRS